MLKQQKELMDRSTTKSIQNDINNARKIEIHKYKTIRTVAGGHLNVPAYSMGSPLCYETEEKIKKARFA